MRSYRREIDPCSDAYVVPRESFEALCLSATDMCGRYTQLLTWEQIVHLYELTADLDPPADFRPRYNIAPNQMAPVMRMKDGRRELAMLQWGLIPSSAKDRSMGDRLINARAESLAEEPAFRAAFRARRCLVVTGGFYEWQRKTKQPFWIGMKDGGEFDMAGLWESWRDHTSGEVIESFAIITTAANALASHIHGRMPVIIDPNDFDTWLAAPSPPVQLLRAYPAEAMETYPVNTWVNSPAHDDPRCVERVDAS